MKRATLHISGSVQHAGYRKRVISAAKSLNIIEIKNALIVVTNVEKEYSHATGEYESFYKLVGEGETDERLDTAADLLKELIGVTRNGFDGLEKKQDIMIEKLDDTRKEIVGEIREMRGDLRSYLDRRLIKIEDDITEIKAKIGLS